uniref:Uncharacterized protein n=1 Tax=Rhizophagus irregularis (strain DAOM 181602 / DAOM 197198 / MUCL 43194) TaxID=747089 RepID=U9UC05_RHIID
MRNLTRLFRTKTTIIILSTQTTVILVIIDEREKVEILRKRHSFKNKEFTFLQATLEREFRTLLSSDDKKNRREKDNWERGIPKKLLIGSGKEANAATKLGYIISFFMRNQQISKIVRCLCKLSIRMNVLPLLRSYTIYKSTKS